MISDKTGIIDIISISELRQSIMHGRHAFLDKLRERMSFEKTGAKLYEALLKKYHAIESESKKRKGLQFETSDLPPLFQLEKFYHEEKNHYEMTRKILVSTGGNTDLKNPDDVCSMVESAWVQMIEDPRTTFVQSLDIILQAELVDNAGWEILIELAETLNMDEAIEKFEHALEEENTHLAYVRAWVSQLYLNGSVDEDPYAMSEEELMDDTSDEDFYVQKKISII